MQFVEVEKNKNQMTLMAASEAVDSNVFVFLSRERLIC